MKKVLAITCLLMLMLCITSSAFATETAWRLKIKNDDGAGSYAAVSAMVGVATNATDGVDVAAGTDVVASYLAIGQNDRWVVGVMAPDTRTWTSTINNQSPAGETWNLRVGAGPNAIGATMRLQFYTVLGQLPTPTVGPTPVVYKLRMIDNRDVLDAPADGTEWIIPIPTVHTSTPYYALTLPVKTFSPYAHGGMIEQGYIMQLQQIVPEPGGLLALGAGLMGLAGFAFKRRKG